jgi:hypothetical protein
MRLLRHKSINNTLIYTQLLDFKAEAKRLEKKSNRTKPKAILPPAWALTISTKLLPVFLIKGFFDKRNQQRAFFSKIS